MSITHEVETLDEELTAQVASGVSAWVSQQRWCPAGRRPLTPVVLWEVAPPIAGYPHAWLLVARFGEDGPLLQVPLVATGPDTVDNGDGHSTIAVVGKWTLSDGTLEPAFWRAWVSVASVLTGTREALAQSVTKVHSLGMEQSNSSVILGGGATPLIAKVFRVLYPGSHPEVQLPAALAEQGWPGVPRVFATWYLPLLPGVLEATPCCSAVVSQMIVGAEDGFDLFVEAAKRRQDPRSEAFALGVLTAQMHRGLHASLGSGPPALPASLTSRVSEELKRASLDDPAHPGQHGDLRERIAQVLAGASRGHTAPLATQRIHGDLHLGQTLRTPDGSWFLLDFEGEPLVEISQRSAPESPLRDVAGMLRSFDYAWQLAHGEPDTKMWTKNARDAFLEGYSSEIALTDADSEVLDVLQIEKALYEVEYEAKFRPNYLGVPLAALEVLANSHGKQSKVRDLKL